MPVILFLPHVRQFTVGLVLTDPPHPTVLGTGVLVSIENLHGILTCCHVADEFGKRSEVGLLRFGRDDVFQGQKLRLGTRRTLKIGGPLGRTLMPLISPSLFSLNPTLRLSKRRQHF